MSTKNKQPPTQRARLAPAERRRMAAMAGFIGALHVLGWGILVAVVVPAHLKAGTTAVGIGIGVTAYTLGLRHAFDADHIAAIDNSTRKLMHDGGDRPVSVGFWFSLGHSSVVFALTLLISFGVRSLDGPVQNQSSDLHKVTNWVGTLVSGSFLYLIAALNIAILVRILRLFRDMRHGRLDEQQLEEQLEKRGFMNRFLGKLTKTVTKPRHMYPIGILFGLGFDTATEVALLVIAGTAGAAGLPWYAILCLPILFAAGMSLLDTIDGSFMTLAYGWAFTTPVRKVFYNITITALSVAVAVVIGTVELGGLVASELHVSGSFWDWFESIDINLLGFIIVGLFFFTWAISIVAWRYGRIEERWTPTRGPDPSEAGG
jgi:nickel/cobalt transporter (NiCoT) family protein